MSPCEATIYMRHHKRVRGHKFVLKKGHKAAYEREMKAYGEGLEKYNREQGVYLDVVINDIIDDAKRLKKEYASFLKYYKGIKPKKE